MCSLISRNHRIAMAVCAMCVFQLSIASAQKTEQSPAEIATALRERLRTATHEEREDVLTDIDDAHLGPDGKPLIPVLLELLKENVRLEKQPVAATLFGPPQELTEAGLPGFAYG